MHNDNGIEFKEESKNMTDIEFWEKYHRILEHQFRSSIRYIDSKEALDETSP